MPAIQRLFVVVLGLALAGPLGAAPADEIQSDLLTGRYGEAVGRAETAAKAAPTDARIEVLLVQGLLATGQYPEADAAATAGLARAGESIQLRWAARAAALADGKPDAAARLATEILQYVQARPWNYRSPADLVVFGRAALLFGADPKDIMDKVLGTAQQDDPNLREVYLARAELALNKHDSDLAAKACQEGLKRMPDDPDLHEALARAYADGDRAAMLAEVSAALKSNPRHVPSLLLLADHEIDSEDYAGADQALHRALAVDPWRPEAWAYEAVLAHLRNRPDEERDFRSRALRFWASNPLVDWLIGKKLSEKYRFAEAAASQRQALRFDPDYLPAKEELANDLLCLGQEDEGWRLAEEIRGKDPYDVHAYNLSALHETMTGYATIQDDDFVVRLPAGEAPLYGARALDLLERAKRALTAKYGVELARPTYVEIFGDQKDFAVRTFGMPNIGGFLGVCFGRVVTVNGPSANTAQMANWETVLWHEFCHVVTLQKTKNKMPRWLSEGISVYEESQADPSWGMHMNPRFREMILGRDLTPVGSLSGAFLVPPDAEHLQFAYFESSLVVDFMINRYGLDSLKAILSDLGAGAEINRTIADHTEPMPALERDFRAYARSRADALAPGLKWDRPPALAEGSRLADWARSHPDNYWALRLQSRQLIEAGRWKDARELLRRFLALYPGQTGPDSAYVQLAAADRALGDAGSERVALARYADLDDNATDACLRLMEIGQAAGDWPMVEHFAERFLAVNPLVEPPYRYLARACENLGDTPGAIAADRTLLLLHPSDPAEAHFQLARLLHRAGDPQARLQVLQALEDAPRYRAALSLLLEIDAQKPPNDP